MDITVGQVSGIIAALFVVIQFLWPNALIVVLVCLIGNQHSAVTWSVAARQIQFSIWPSVLRSDSATGNGVYGSVKRLARLRPIGGLLIAAAAVITPLGLYDAIVPETGLQQVGFVHLSDSGSMGFGTPPQGADVFFNRVCGGYGGSAPCPGSGNDISIETDPDTGFTTYGEFEGTYNITVLPTQRELYSGGLEKFSKTVSSFFDIRYRQFAWMSKSGENDNKRFPVDSWRMLESLILDSELEAVEGLVVDMVTGGVGFRNHTVPSQINVAAEWSEDLLFLEPVTECVDTNLTLEFTLPDPPSSSALDIENVSIIDNGGFVNLIQDYPMLNMDDNQNNPKLRERAYKAAWLTNVYSALILNVTRPSPDAFGYLNSALGQRFPLAAGSSVASPASIFIDRGFSYLVNPEKNTLTVSNNSYTNQTYTTGQYENPFNLTYDNFSTINILCQGTGGADYANSSNIQVQCGLFFAAAQRVDGPANSSSLILEANSTWQQSVYSCATLNKASIKTVNFRYNASLGADLKSLQILNITDKRYNNSDSGSDDLPTWGIEQPRTPFPVSDINQLWGLVSPTLSDSDATSQDLALKKAKELYLPGYVWSISRLAGMSGYEYNPGGGGPKDIIAATYDVGSATGSRFDYSGFSNLALFRKWQDLSANLTNVPTILDLIWTDIAANTLMGSRGWDSDGGDATGVQKRDEGSGSGTETSVPVLLYRRRVRYKWVYGIPALIVLCLVGLVVLTSLVFSVVKQGPARVKYYINQLSAGRLLAMQHYPGQCDKGAPTKVWVERVGKEIVDITQAGPAAAYGMGMKGDVMSSAVEVYPMSPMNGRNHQGYVKMHENGQLLPPS